MRTRCWVDNGEEAAIAAERVQCLPCLRTLRFDIEAGRTPQHIYDSFGPHRLRVLFSVFELPALEDMSLELPSTLQACTGMYHSAGYNVARLVIDMSRAGGSVGLPATKECIIQTY